MKTHLAWRWEPGRSATHPAGRSSQRCLEKSEEMNSCFPTRAAVGLSNSSRVVVRRQAGRVGGGTLHCRWRLTRPDSSVCYFEASWEAVSVAHGDIFADNHITAVPAHVSWLSSAHALFNVWPDHNQKQTSSLSVSSIHHRCRSILFSPTFDLPQYARFPLFLSPRHDLFWLPDVSLCSLLWSLGENLSEYPICSFLGFVFRMGGAAYCKSRVTRRQGIGRMKERKNEVKMKSCTMSQRSWREL